MRMRAWLRRSDIVGLSLAPPELVLVLCVDDKLQTQALERFSMRLGQEERSGHDFGRAVP